MSSSVNRVILVGRLGKDPVIRSLGSGDRIASFSLATDETWRDKSTGERKQKTEWHNVVIFNDNIVKVVEQYVTKGSQVYVEGSLQTRKWTDKDGVDRYTTEVVIQRFNGQLTMLSSKREGGERDSDSERGSGGGYGAASGAGSYTAGSGGRLQPSGPKESFPADPDDVPFVSMESVW